MPTSTDFRSAEPSQGLALHPARLCAGLLVLAALASYLFQVIDFMAGLRSQGLLPAATNRDFVNYWIAGRFVLDGDQQALFSHDAYFAQLSELFPDAEIRSWSYPPHFLLIVWPLGLLPYKAALLLFLIATFALFLCAVVTFRNNLAPDSDRLLLYLSLIGYVLMMLVATQNGFLTAAMLLFGFAWMRERPILAGIAFAALTVKPQLGFLIPLLLLVDRNWRTVASAAIFSAALVLLSALLFGSESWHAYLTETLAYQRSVMTDWYGIFLRMMPTVFGSVRTLGYSPEAAMIAQLPVSICAVATVFWILRVEQDGLRRMFAVACGTFLITPYAFNYDMGGLAVIGALLAGENRLDKKRPAAIALALAAALPAAVTNIGRVGLPVAPLILAAALVVVAIEARRRNATIKQPVSGAGRLKTSVPACRSETHSCEQ